MIRVGINGFGTVGKRVADAISLQDDMTVSGVTVTKPSYKLRAALDSKYRVFSALPEKSFEGASGDIFSLIDDSDIIVDSSPKLGAENKKLYEQKGVKGVFQGGEKHDLTGISFNAQCNFNQALGKDFVRVVSCGTTALCRTVGLIDRNFGVENCYVVLVRRSADPHDSKKGPINAIIPETEIPSHHGPDVKTVLPHIKIITTAVKVPTTLMHVHVVSIKLKEVPAVERVLDLFDKTSRILLVDSGEGLRSTAEIMDLARDMGRKRSDLYEIAVWQDSVSIKQGVLYYMQAIHQESDVVPENVDAIRAMFKMCPAEESIEKTNKALNIK